MQKRRTWLETAARYALLFVVLVTAVPLAAYVHENAGQWVVPAALIALVLSVLCVAWYWRTRRNGWLVAILSLEFLTFAFTSALIQGEEGLAVGLLFGVSIVYTMTAFIVLLRARRRFESAMRAIGEEINGDPLFRREVLFRDDGQRIVVYPRRRRLLIGVVIQGSILTGIGVAFTLWRSADAIVLWIALGLFACILIYFFLASLYRLVVRKPAIVVGPDGIRDTGTVIWSGVGLVRWDEILSVTPSARKQGWITYHYLDILVSDLPGLRRRLPLLKRLALRLASYSGWSQLNIAQWMLETPVDDLAAQIDQYVESHAPPGWRDIGTADEVPTPDDSAEA